MGWPKRANGAVLLALVCATTVHADPKDFDIDAKPVFSGSTAGMGSSAMAIVIENKGPDARGQLLVGSGESITRYPIDLPRGSKKRIVTYPVASPYGGGDSEFILDTDQGRVKIPMLPGSSYAYGGSNMIAMIGETSGDLGFLRQEERKNQNQNQSQAYFDSYCKPEDAPDRPVGYEAMAAVVLGEGSERLSDGAVKALKLYALSGGTLVFSGGASAPILSDPRWTAVLPATNFQTKTVSGNGLPTQLTGAPIGESYTIAAGTPIAAATAWRDSNGNLAAASRPMGLGKVVLVAFNLFEDPFVRWMGRKRLFTQLAKVGDFSRAQSFLAQFQNSGYNYDYGYGAPVAVAYPATAGTTAGGMSYYGGAYQDRSDPFNVELPTPNRVFWILAGFFVTVVPLNFIILRKLKRGELAWVTAPVISLIFAGIFLNQASDLYSAKLSTATNGLMIAQEGVPNAIFIGNTQMFFPNGGSYDLKLENVDELGNSSPYENYYGGGGFGGRQSTTDLNPVDVGTVQVPDMRAANLAFEEISYRQIFDAERYFDVKWLGSGKARITNVSKRTLADISLACRGTRTEVGTLAPGENKDVDVKAALSETDRRRINPSDLDQLTAITYRSKTMIIVASISDMRPGPQIGAQVGKRSGIRLAYVMSEPQGGAR